MNLPPRQVDLDQYVEAVNAGVSAEVARKEIWNDRQPTVILSLVDDSVVGWDTCGTCQKPVSRCNCNGGPSVPSYVKTWRTAPVERQY